jgi:hypothetical protein
MATYNGWNNYETWAVALWLDNEEGSYRYWRECAKAVLRENVRVDEAKSGLASMLRDQLQEAMPDLGCSLWADLLNSAFCEVDWHEIAASMLEEFEGKVELLQP